MEKLISEQHSELQIANQWVQIGLSHHQASQLEQANEAYQKALIAFPNHPDALHLLGMLAHQIGDQPLAEELIKLAINVNPALANYHCNLGAVLQAQGKLSEAFASFRRAIEIEPDNANLYYNLGHAQQTNNQFSTAIESYTSAIKLMPQHIQAISNLGHTYRALGEKEMAVKNFRKAIVVAPDNAELHFNLGVALAEQSEIEEAIASYENAIALSANYAQAHCNLGAACLAKNQLEKAEASYRKAIKINPGLSDAHYNLGISLQAQNKLDAAISSFRKTIELQPKFVEGYCNLGNALRESGALTDAVDCYKQALIIKPDYANAYSNLLFLLGYHALTPASEYLSLAKGWEVACVSLQLRTNAQKKKFTRKPLTTRRIKVGYVSGDFRKHAVSFFIGQLFAHHDKDKVELFAYSNNRTRDEVTEQLNNLVNHWVPIASMSDEEVCNKIESDEIDVLVDLSAHSAHNRLGVFARRVAPVQATYLYFASTGLSEIDYWLGDEVLTPPALDNQFSERVWRLPRVWLSYQPISATPDSHWCPASDGTIWLGCFNNLGKISTHSLRLWSSIMHVLPQSRLLLKNKELADKSNRERILKQLAEMGVESSRVELQSGSTWNEYMAQHDRVDIALDPVGGHGGGTSTCDALWMGVPVIHLLGDRVGSRFAAPLLSAINQGEWVVESESEYINKVVALAMDVEQRKALRTLQRNKMSNSALCDAPGLARALESAYRSMYHIKLESRLILETAK